MINPGEIPQIPGDMDALAAQASALKDSGAGYADTGADVHGVWQRLTPIYIAPESEQLLQATVPVKQVSAQVGSNVEAAAGALSTYAETVKPIKLRLESLRLQAEAFVASVQGDDDWTDDDDKIDEHNQLMSQVNRAVDEWMDAQRACANSINVLYGGTRYLADNGDGNQAANEFGYNAEQLDSLATSEQGLPWGKAEEKDKGFMSDVGHGLLDVGGLVPLVGEAADGANAVWYLAEGDRLNAGLSAAGMVPFLGWGATGTKAIGKGVKAAKGAEESADAAKGLKPIGDAGRVTDHVGPEGQNIGRAATGHKKFPVREVRTRQEIDQLYGELSRGGTKVAPDSYPGEMVEMPDGTIVGYRETSKTSPDPTIDIKTSDGLRIKVHVNPEGW